MALANQAIPAMGAADTNCTIVGPAVAYIDTSFLTTCFTYGNVHPDKKGLLDLVNGVSVHPYLSSPRNGRGRLRHGSFPDADVLQGKTVPIVSSEWGYSTGTTNYYYTPVASPQVQGDYLARTYLVNLSQGIPLSAWYDWANDGNSTDYEANFGTVTLGLAAKPAYNELTLLTTSLKGTTFVGPPLSDGNSNDWLLVFKTSTGHETLAAWTTGTSHTVTVSGWGTLQLTSTPFYVDPVPEPNTLVLLTIGLLGLLAYAWRNQK